MSERVVWAGGDGACVDCGRPEVEHWKARPGAAFNAAHPDFQRFLHRVTKRAHDDGAAEVIAVMEALAAEWERIATERRPHLGCFDMYRHLAGEVRSALAETRVIPPTDGGTDE